MDNPPARVDLARFYLKLDQCFGRDDLPAARACIVFWEGEARRCGDDRALLSILNEAVGLYRRTRDEAAAGSAVAECLSLLDRLGLGESLSGATITVNAATTLSSFGKTEEGLALYDRAAAAFEATGKTDTYEYAAYLNNRAGALCSLARYDEAESCWTRAVNLLDGIGRRDAEIAISLLMLAHLSHDRDPSDGNRVAELLDLAWDRLNEPDQDKGADYAFALRKCAPSFEAFGRREEAQALRDVADEIYREGR